MEVSTGPLQNENDHNIDVYIYICIHCIQNAILLNMRYSIYSGMIAYLDVIENRI